MKKARKLHSVEENHQFTLRLEISPLQRIQSDNSSLTMKSLLADKDVLIQTAELDGAGNKLPFKWSRIIDCNAAGFPSASAALAAGLDFRDIILVSSCASGIWFRVGNDRLAAADDTSSTEVKGARPRIKSSDAGLTVHKHELYRGVGFGAFLVNSGDAQRWQENLIKASRKGISLNPQQRLALELYGLAHFESTVRTQFIILISVIEILSIRDRRPQESQNLLDEFVKRVEEVSLEQEQRKSLLQSLMNLRKDSISNSCKKLMNAHLGDKEAKDFSKLYGLRSKIIHEGNPKDGIDFNAEASELTKLVTCLVYRMFLG